MLLVCGINAVIRKRFTGIPVARYRVFALADGSYAVQWDDKRVQELLTGKYRDFDARRDFGHPINEFELKQLKDAGRVEHFNRDYVWLMALPETGRYGVRREMGRGDRVRAYYLRTSFPVSQLSNLQMILSRLDIADRIRVMPRSSELVVMGENGSHFRSTQEAEQVQQTLTTAAPDLFGELTIAFDEISNRLPQVGTSTVDDELPTLEELIASQRDTSVTAGRQIVMAIPEEDERTAFDNLFENMEMRVEHADSASQALELLEDHHPDLLLMDLVLPDMHGWQMIRKIKEIETLRTLPVMVITSELNIGMTVATVDYLTRPVSIARLRHNVWKILSANPRSLEP